MSSPTESEIKTQIANAVATAEHLKDYAGENTPNYIGDEDTFIQSIETDYSDRVTGAFAKVRSHLNSSLLGIGEAISPYFLEYARVLGFSERDFNAAFDRVFRDYALNSKRVNSRGFSFGTITQTETAGGDTGVINRLNVDAYGFTIEAQTPDAKIAECIRDRFTGTREFEEEFLFTGASAEKDLLKVTGSGKRKVIAAISAGTSRRYVNNPSFSEYAGTLAVPTSITDWTPDSGNLNAFEIVESDYYRNIPGEATPRSLKIKDNDKLIQTFETARFQANAATPMYVQIAYNREIGSGDGTLRLKFGSIVTTVVLAAQTGWNILRMPIGTNNWYLNFGAGTVGVVEIGVSGSSTGGGYTLVDDLIIAPFTEFDGSFYTTVSSAPSGGGNGFAFTSKFEWTDSLAGADSIIQQWLWKYFNRYLPAATGTAVTFSDPS